MKLTRSSLWLLSAGALVLLLSAGAENQPPVANAGGPYFAECQGDVTKLTLDGTASYDPDGTPLQFLWHEECPNTWFDDPTSPTPNLYVMGAGCEWSCQAIDLTVTSGGQSDKAHARVTVSDTLPPTLALPGDVYQPWGIDTTPAGTGWPVAFDTCSADPTLVYVDNVYTPANQPGMERIIERTWITTDACGNATSKLQLIHLIGPNFGGYNLEIDPQGCADLFSMGDPQPVVTVVLAGNERLAVQDIDLSSLHVSLKEYPCGCLTVSPPTGAAEVDVLVAAAKGPDECNPTGFDGWLDLPIRLDRGRMCAMMEMAQFCGGEPVQLTVVGQRHDKSWFWAATLLDIEN